MPLHPRGYLCAFLRAQVALVLWILVPAPSAAATLSVPAGGDLQAALNAAQPGDVILLAPGATYTGNFTLPVKTGAQHITVRTAPGDGQPAPGRRVQPWHTPLLARIRSANSLPALATDAGSHHWRLELLEFSANQSGYGEIIRLGRGGVEQSTVESIPFEIVIDRCYIHGDPLVGQKRGVALNSASTTIRDSYISDMKGVGMDTQAIAGWNGPGPYLIENNYLEGAGENVMFGGADAKVTNLVPSDITVRGNYMSKPRSWQQPIIAAPAAAAVEPLAGAGSLPAGVYGYRIVARRSVGQGVVGTSLPSAEATASLTSTGAVRVSWAAVEGVTEYRVHGRTAGGQSMFWTVNGTSFTDSGTAGTAGTPPTAGTRWTVKNIFELKNARRVLVEGNIFENSWRDGQTGVALVFTPRNQDGTALWSVVSDITVRFNIVRSAAGAVNVNGYDTNHVSQQGRDFLFTDNLFYDITAPDGAAGRFMQIGGGPANVVVDHNTIDQTGTLLYVYGKRADGTYDMVQGFRFANNLALHNTYGIMGESAGGYGSLSIRTYFLEETRVTRNVMAGGPATRYTGDNLFPDVATHRSEFADQDYHLREGSPYRDAGTDGRDLGADIGSVLLMTANAISGDTTRNAPPTSVPGGPYAEQTLTSITFDGGGSADPDGTLVTYVWSWSDGCPNTDGAVATHTFSRSGSYGATLTVRDDQGAVASATATVSVINRPPLAAAGGPYSGVAGTSIAVSASASSDLDGSISGYRWTWGDGSPDTTGTAPSASHVYATAGDYQVAVTVTDDEGASGSAGASMHVSEPAPDPPTPVAPEIVVWTSDLPSTAIRGNWVRDADATAAGGAKLSSRDFGAGATHAPLAAPRDYFDVTFDARANTPYRIWLRMAAAKNSKWNDAVWVQLSDAIDAANRPVYRIGTTGGLLVNLAVDSSGSSVRGWGWQNGAYWLQQTTTVRFAADGIHTLRVQVREDGVQVDQIVLSPAKYLNSAPGPVSRDTTIVPKPLTDIVLYGADIAPDGTWWQRTDDTGAAGGVRVFSPDAGWASSAAPLPAPTRYFDLTIQPQANLDYRVWLRLNAAANSKYNDAVWIQFSDVIAGGVTRYQIGTADGLLVNLATTAGAETLRGWGWQNGAYWKTETEQPTIVRFPTTGTHTIRVQVREDGVALDQIVLSPGRFMDAAPGEESADATIISKP